MPQLPTSTAEEYGAEDEIKQYNQEEDEGSDISTVDVVNDIKDDLLNEDNTDGNKNHDENLYRSSRYLKGESSQGVYGSPAAVIVGPHRYYDQTYRTPVTNHNGGSIHGSSNSYASGTQIRMPMYMREERGYYEQNPWPPSPVGMGSHPSYPVHGYAGQKYGGSYRYPPGIPPGVPYYMPSGNYPGMPGRPPKEPKRPHVKKPLNAFMLYMKEQRPKIAAEFTLKESAAINQILGKRWHALDKSEQAKYYEMARKERAIHMQLYPGWSARDNYAQIGRKKKRPRDKNEEMNPKKCRARYGLDRQEQWCKPCRRKKKCIRFLVGADGETREVTPEVADQLEHSDSDENSNNPQIKENQLPTQVDSQAETKAQELLKSISNDTSSEPKLSLINNNTINNEADNCRKKLAPPPLLLEATMTPISSHSTNRTSTVSHYANASSHFQDHHHNNLSKNFHSTSDTFHGTPESFPSTVETTKIKTEFVAENTETNNSHAISMISNDNPNSPAINCSINSNHQPLDTAGVKSIRASCA